MSQREWRIKCFEIHLRISCSTNFSEQTQQMYAGLRRTAYELNGGKPIRPDEIFAGVVRTTYLSAISKGGNHGEAHFQFHGFSDEQFEVQRVELAKEKIEIEKIGECEYALKSDQLLAAFKKHEVDEACRKLSRSSQRVCRYHHYVGCPFCDDEIEVTIPE